MKTAIDQPHVLFLDIIKFFYKEYSDATFLYFFSNIKKEDLYKLSQIISLSAYYEYFCFILQNSEFITHQLDIIDIIV